MSENNAPEKLKYNISGINKLRELNYSIAR